MVPKKHVKKNEKPKNVLTGIDDATKCPCIGSIFIAGVSATNATIRKWKKAGVKDSKLITAKKRERLAELIKKTALAYSIHDIPPLVIDDKRVNLNTWEMIFSLKIIQDLYTRTSLERIYIDNWEVTEKVFKSRFLSLISTHKTLLEEQKITEFDRQKLLSLWIIPEHYADENHVIVGAASILAKVASDEQYAQYRKIYGDFGSGNPGDKKTRLFVWTHRQNPPPIIRTSWLTYKTLALLDSLEKDAIYQKQNVPRGKKKSSTIAHE